MTESVYTFLPWLRRGVANEITEPATARSRARVAVSVTASDSETSTAPVVQNFELNGPGDVIGITTDEIVRVEPRDWVTDFEPNYLPFVEFYDEDLPWRYTPKGLEAGGRKLIPWLTLLVLRPDEFLRNQAVGRPLTSIQPTVADLSSHFPPDDQLWAWAHVQVAEDLGDGAAPDAEELTSILDETPDRGSSRIISPRKLDPNQAYHAFLIPTFELGRKAGLDEAIDDETESGLTLAWASGAEFPIYHEWYFRTGERGDFEELARRLVPRAVDPRVGVRDMDIAAPGFGMSDVVPAVDTTHHKGVVGLEGALKSLDMQPKELDPQSDFRDEVATIINAASNAQRAETTDPIVAPPIYGRWHALVDTVDPVPATPPANTSWIDELNHDARFRAASGLGARVIRGKQERYMRLAWEQVGEVLAANRQLSLQQFALEASQAQYVKTVAKMPKAETAVLTSSVWGRILGSSTTLRAQLTASRLPVAALSGPMRKLLRPRGPVAIRALPKIVRRTAASWIARGLNDGTLTADPARPPVAGATVEEGIEGAVADVSSRLPTYSILGLALALILLVLLAFLLLPLKAAIVAAFAMLGVGGYAIWRFWKRRQALTLTPPTAITPGSVAAADPPNDFGISEPGAAPGTTPPLTAAELGAFGTTLAEFAELFEISPPAPEPKPAFDFGNAHGKTLAAIEPLVAFPKRAAAQVRVGETAITTYVRDVFVRDLAQTPRDRIVPAMAYPDIKEGMYSPLAKLGDELLVPNLGLVPPNTVSLMLTNQPFIEAYMVGLNHEFARELLWREYPTDQRGSPFRQFWNVIGIPDPDGLSEAERAEAMKDIPPIHEWGTSTELGAHNHRDVADDEDRIVLVVRGDLLKRYPNTILYAQAARWGEDDRENQLILHDEDGSRAAADPNDPDIRFPIFKAEVKPDLHFVGFDLGLKQVRGHPDLEETEEARTSVPADELGWFFVLQEMVGEPRLGLDVDRPAQPSERTWDNLAWPDINLSHGPVVDVAKPFVLAPAGTDDDGLVWGANAADMAAILFQKPAMVAVHAREMLADLGD